VRRGQTDTFAPAASSFLLAAMPTYSIYDGVDHLGTVGKVAPRIRTSKSLLRAS
jgi:hypothetical protein